MGIIQIGAIGVIGAILAIQFKSGKSEYGIYISIALSLLIFFSIVGKLETIVQVIKSIGEKIQIKSTYITALLKMLGVTYVAEFSSAICKDAGYQTIAQQIEIFSKLTILALSMPILLALLETIQAFLG
ncbi:stage III sporulation protein AD [Lachnospiraceae bacterium 2_1_46FAA]|nr:stage III sporulation protein AD [Lachnospiraceae bacterium 2_1_46FAA]